MKIGNNIFPSYYIIETNIKDAKKIEENIINLEGVKKTNGAFNLTPYLFMISEILEK